MLLQFEEDILRYFVEPKNNASKYFKKIDHSIFELVDHQILYQLIVGFYEDFRKVPTKTDLTEYSLRQLESGDYAEDLSKSVLILIKRKLFKPPESTESFIKDTLIEHAAYKMSRNLFKDYGTRLKEGIGIFKEIKSKMSDILSMFSEDVEVTCSRGGDIMQNGGYIRHSTTKILATVFEGLNQTMGARGISSPELVVIMSEAKSFKTGMLLVLACSLARVGYKVYYADGENGYKSIVTRQKQFFCECTKLEVINDTFDDPDLEDITVSDMFESISRDIRSYGGALVTDSFAPGTSSISDVSASLDQYREEDGFIPDIIFYDAYEHFIPDKDQGSDTLNSQKVIKDIIGLNMRLGCSAVTPVQVNRGAIGKDKFSIADVGRDYGVIRFAHVVLAMVANELERACGLLQLWTVVQREGQSDQSACMVHIDPPNMQAKEISTERASDILEKYIQENGLQKEESVKKEKPNRQKLNAEGKIMRNK